MRHSLTVEPAALPDLVPYAGHDWRKALIPFSVAWIVLLLAFANDWLTISHIAWNSSAFNHILLIPVILGFLVHQRLPQLAKIEPQRWWPGLLITAAGAVSWLLGAFSGLDAARQLGAVLMLISTVPLFLGVKASAGLIFPLGYALLLVPFGQELVPPLQLITADITISLVELSGIRAAIDGVFIDTPAGLFEVAEACSGVQFLIAMVALGLLTANVCFKSWRRRVVFLAACVIVPIIANGIRAFGTVYAAQFVGAEKAVGFDHIIYGWIFFALIVALVIGGAWRYFDRPQGDPMIDAEAINASSALEKLARWRIGAVPALVALVLVIGGVQGWARVADTLSADMPDRIALPAVEGWNAVPFAPRLHWEPRAHGSDHRLLGSYRDAEGRQVDVFFALYASQGEGREAGGFGQGALTPQSEWSWHSPGPRFDGGKSELLRGHNGDLRLAVTWYRSGKTLTGSNARLKLRNMADRLALSAEPTAMIILSSVNQNPDLSRDAIAAFLRDAGPLGEWMDHVAWVR